MRTELDDNIRVTRERLAKSNAELVALAAEKLARNGVRPARPDEARAMLGLGAGERAAKARIERLRFAS